MKNRFLNLLILSSLSLICAACIGMANQSQYPKEMVQPVIVKKISTDMLSIQYSVPPESMKYSTGVNYKIKNDVIKVIIDRCTINRPCQPMVEASKSTDESWVKTVLIPHTKEKVVMVYRDQEEQVYP